MIEITRWMPRLGQIRVGRSPAAVLAVLFLGMVAACAGPTGGRTPGPVRDQAPQQSPLVVPPALSQWRPLLERLHADGQDASQVSELLARPGVRFDPAPMADKLETLYRLLFASNITKDIQRGLAQLGYDAGPDDGMAGSRTRGAIREFQELHAMEQDGEPTEELLAAVRADLALPPGARPTPTGSHGKDVEAPRWHESALRPEVIAKGREFLAANRALFLNMERAYSVPPEIVAAILSVETRLGEYLGQDNAFEVLASMALSRDVSVILPYLWQTSFSQEERAFLADKARERGDWAYGELKALLAHAREQGRDPLSYRSSPLGAVGVCQFMPSNILPYGVDGDHDGDVDLYSLPDAVFSTARYFQGHGWRPGLSDAEQREAVYAYNHSSIYVNTIMELASRLRQ